MTVLSVSPILTTNPSFTHLHALLGPAGVIQFSRGTAPDPTSGTCLDDNARAWIVAIYALRADPEQPYARLIGDAAAQFVADAQRQDGRFHNFADVSGRFTDDVGSEDSFGRTIWACGIAARCAPVKQWRDIARKVLAAAAPVVAEVRSPHARAYIVLGLAAAFAPEKAAAVAPLGEPLDAPLLDDVERALTAVAGGLLDHHTAAASHDWPWWENHLTWGNGRLPEAMLRAALATGDRQYAATGMRALDFLAGITQSGTVFVPIGNQGWRLRSGARAFYDQQPIEACAMVDAWLAAHRLTGDLTYRDAAQVAFDWFHGGNTERLALAVPTTGACFDGLHPGHVNQNQGAESTLSYLHAHLAINASLSDAPEVE
ncbi:MAG TPA: hypothetical protein VID19_12690 [Candidatus Eremiobacteraceae bacterium]